MYSGVKNIGPLYCLLTSQDYSFNTDSKHVLNCRGERTCSFLSIVCELSRLRYRGLMVWGESLQMATHSRGFYKLLVVCEGGIRNPRQNLRVTVDLEFSIRYDNYLPHRTYFVLEYLETEVIIQWFVHLIRVKPHFCGVPCLKASIFNAQIRVIESIRNISQSKFN